MENIFIFTVSELNRAVKSDIEPLYKNIWVEGEISNVRIPVSGHCYFTLKDETSQIRAVMFRFKNRLVQFRLSDGMKIICKADINVYEPRGEYQLLVEKIEPKGAGELQLAFEQLKNRLREEGIFDDKHKKSLPMLPRRVAVITSATGAAVRDVIRVIKNRFINMDILVVPVKVQGGGSAEEIRNAIETINRKQLSDVIMLARGGGSIEDLWAFNEEIVARAVYGSQIPVITGIGHEVDFTIADFAADVRAATPSAAAETVVREKREFLEMLKYLCLRSRKSLENRLSFYSQKLQNLSAHISSPEKIIITHRLRCDELNMRICRLIDRIMSMRKKEVASLKSLLFSRSPVAKLQNAAERLSYNLKNLKIFTESVKNKKQSHFASLAGKLNALSPLNVLERGYSITRMLPDFKVVRDASNLNKGDMVNVRLSRGEIECCVEKVK